jgi:hypothetical protein
MMSSMRLIWLKMSTREPFSFIALRSLSRMSILPELWTRCSSVVYGGPGSWRTYSVDLLGNPAQETTYRAVEEIGMTSDLAQL